MGQRLMLEQGCGAGARRVAKRIRSGNVHVNGAQPDFSSAFGGYNQSENAREWGEAGLDEFLELKSVFGYGARWVCSHLLTRLR